MVDVQRNLTVQFVDSNGNECGAQYRLSSNVTVKELNNLINSSLKNETDKSSQYSFFITNNVENEKAEFSDGNCIVSTVENAILSSDKLKAFYEIKDNDDDANIEKVLRIVFHPRSIFKVRHINRCTASMPGHTKAVLVAQFSHDGRFLATGSADHFVRFWDLNTQLPMKADSDPVHRASVKILRWSPDGKFLASSCNIGSIFLWVEEKLGNWVKKGGPLLFLQGRSRSIVKALVWQPLHLSEGKSILLAAAYENTNVVIWNVESHMRHVTISGHEKPVRAMTWTGSNMLVCCCEDGCIKIWQPTNTSDRPEQPMGVLLLKLAPHSHWINSVSLNTDYVLRCGLYNPMKPDSNGRATAKLSKEEVKQKALEAYNLAKGSRPERMVVCSDDKTLSLWTPSETDKPIAARMTGHMATIVDVRFSPDGMFIASASFDKSIRLWDGMTGKYIETLSGHFLEVLLTSWSCDSQLLVSCSLDSTIKLWNTAQVRGLVKPIEELPVNSRIKKLNTAPNCKRVRLSHLAASLPGHGDSVFALDWSPDGGVVASGGKDGLVRLWKA